MNNSKINNGLNKTILITWWTWYIWSHAVVKLQELWYKVIIIDNLSNSNKDSLDNIYKITNIRPIFYNIDLRNKEKLEKVFKENEINSVIHFAWAKAVWESCEKPFYYYDNNINGSVVLFELMDKYNVRDIVFSSSATVYDPSEKSPFNEKMKTWNTTNPYWTAKLIIENILRDLSNHKKFNAINLRYFNPIWAHSSGLIWEDPNWIPNNLLPFILKVVSWELKELKVFWWDYKTKDWTWERDYIHIDDLIDWHIKTLEFIEQNKSKYKDKKTWIYEEINLWTWNATSVLEMIKITKEITWKKIKYKIEKRREWDLPVSYCNPDKAKKILNWEAKYTVKEWIKSWYNFIKNK